MAWLLVSPEHQPPWYYRLSIYHSRICHDTENITTARNLKFCSDIQLPKDTHNSTLWASYWMSFGSLLEKGDREISKVHCIGWVVVEVFYESRFQLPASFLCWEVVGNANIFFIVSWNIFSTTRVRGEGKTWKSKVINLILLFFSRSP